MLQFDLNCWNSRDMLCIQSAKSVKETVKFDLYLVGHPVDNESKGNNNDQL